MAEIKTGALWRAVLAESLGMIMFIFIGLSAAIGDRNNSDPDQEIKVVLAFGLAVRHWPSVLVTSAVPTCHHPRPPGLLPDKYAQGLFLHDGPDFGSSGWQCHCLDGISPLQGFGVEFLLTLQLFLCVITDKRRDLYWAGPMSGGLVASLLYDFLLAPRNERFREKTRVLFCCGHKKCTSRYKGVTAYIAGAKTNIYI
ncbi:hypothetical protein NQZ68_001437 [Dissostichus eleginoides]|nr:hypothetical protein NQZ68_001437 [Dissostichus eleginoides]